MADNNKDNNNTIRGLSQTEGMKSYENSGGNDNWSKVTGADSNFFKGTWDFRHGEVGQYDPFIGGYAFIVWTRLPDFFDENMKTRFKWMTMRNFKSFDGISDIELGTEALTAGFTGNEFNVPTNITKGNTEFTLKHQELSGSPIRELYNYWITGIRDFDTGVATYHGRSSSYSIQNHTGELLYIVTDPSGGTLQNSVEFAAYYSNVFPTKIPMSHLNYNSGEHSLTEIDISFKGIFHQSDKINKIACDHIGKIAQFRHAYQYDPDSTVANTSVNTTITNLYASNNK